MKFEYNCPGHDVKLPEQFNLSGVWLDNRKVFCTPGPWTKPFERIFYRSINNIITFFKQLTLTHNT